MAAAFPDNMTAVPALTTTRGRSFQAREVLVALVGRLHGIRIGADHSVESHSPITTLLITGEHVAGTPLTALYDVMNDVRGRSRWSRRKEPGSTRAGSGRRQSHVVAAVLLLIVDKEVFSWSRLLAGPAGCCPAGHGQEPWPTRRPGTGPRPDFPRRGRRVDRANRSTTGARRARPTCCPLVFTKYTRASFPTWANAWVSTSGSQVSPRPEACGNWVERTAATPAAQPNPWDAPR